MKYRLNHLVGGKVIDTECHGSVSRFDKRQVRLDPRLDEILDDGVPCPVNLDEISLKLEVYPRSSLYVDAELQVAVEPAGKRGADCYDRTQYKENPYDNAEIFE